MPERDREGWPLACDIAGSPDAPAALLLHDIPDDRRAWQALSTAMAADFRTIAPDLRGFGESGAPDPATTQPPAMHDYAADLIALLDGCKVERCSVVGAGFGAEVALQLALDAPARVARLVLNDVVPVPDHPSYGDDLRAAEALRAEQGRRARRFGIERVAATAHTGDYLRTSTRLRYQRIDPDAFAAAHEARARRDAALPRLATLAVPTLVVAGAANPFVTAAELLAETLPAARLVTLDCGAGAPFVAQRAFEGALGEFLGATGNAAPS